MHKLHKKILSAALDALLLPMDTAVADFPVVNLTTIIAGYLKLGQPVRVNHDINEGEWVRVTEGDEKIHWPCYH